MKKINDKNLILIFSAAVVFLGILYFLVYPLVLGFLQKPQAKINSELTIDKNVLKKIDDLKDNSVILD